MPKGSGLRSFLRWAGYIVLALLIAFVGLVIYRIPIVGQKERSAQMVERIHAQKLTMADVDGKHLPPPPDPKLVDATVEGIDANQNGIRDDVELAIFRKYPNELKLRAALLQYAMMEQMYLTSVFNTDTWRAVAVQVSRAHSCISSVLPSQDIQEHVKRTSVESISVEELVFNNFKRRTARDGVYEFESSYTLYRGEGCDI